MKEIRKSRPESVIVSDASNIGFGFVIDNLWSFGTFDKEWSDVT